MPTNQNDLESLKKKDDALESSLKQYESQLKYFSKPELIKEVIDINKINIDDTSILFILPPIDPYQSRQKSFGFKPILKTSEQLAKEGSQLLTKNPLPYIKAGVRVKDLFKTINEDRYLLLRRGFEIDRIFIGKEMIMLGMIPAHGVIMLFSNLETANQINIQERTVDFEEVLNRQKDLININSQLL